MYRYIHAATDRGTLVNKVGKYLKKHIDGAYKIEFSGMSCTVTMKMYYQVEDDPDSFNEMDLLIELTSYSNKIRVNLTEDTEMEKTIGQVILDDDELHDLSLAQKKILQTLKRAIAREYSNYIFIY